MIFWCHPPPLVVEEVLNPILSRIEWQPLGRPLPVIGAISAIGPVQFMTFIILDHNRVEFKQIAQDGVVLHAIHRVMVSDHVNCFRRLFSSHNTNKARHNK